MGAQQGREGQTGAQGDLGPAGPAGPAGVGAPGAQISLPSCVVTAGENPQWACRGATYDEAHATAYWANNSCNGSNPSYTDCVGPPFVTTTSGGYFPTAPGLIKPVLQTQTNYWPIANNAKRPQTSFELYQIDASRDMTCPGKSYCNPSESSCKEIDASLCTEAWKEAPHCYQCMDGTGIAYGQHYCVDIGPHVTCPKGAGTSPTCAEKCGTDTISLPGLANLTKKIPCYQPLIGKGDQAGEHYCVKAASVASGNCPQNTLTQPTC
jgi:hypothetical protein